jgi:hypothetical protein
MLSPVFLYPARGPVTQANINASSEQIVLVSGALFRPHHQTRVIRTKIGKIEDLIYLCWRGSASAKCDSAIK